jgi:hypothetical protein
MLKDSLVSFLRLLGVPEEQILASETPSRCALATSVPAGDIQRLSEGSFTGLVEKFGSGLTLYFGERDAPIIAIENGNILESPKQGLEFIRKREGTSKIRFELLIEKRQILERLGLEEGAARNLYFFFGQNLLAYFRKPLHELDREVFDGARPAAIIVSDVGYSVSGSFLNIIPESRYVAEKPRIPSPDRGVLQRVMEYQSIAAENLSWGSFDLKNITPLHFLCCVEGPGQNEILSLITNRLLLLFILYTANRSNYLDGAFQSFYSSSEQTVQLKVSGSSEIVLKKDLLARFVIWLSRGGEADRLAIIQNAVARELAGEKPDENFEAFVSRLGAFLADARWHYRIFIDGQIDKHFDQIEQLSEYVSGVASDVSTSIDSVTKGFTDAFLAAVGVVVVTFLAALIKNEAQSSIFLITMRVYAGYLLVFQLFYRMGSILHSYILLGIETGDRIEEYTARLGRKRVDPLVAPLNGRKRQFNLWFWLTALFYVAIAIVLWFLAESLPPILVQTGILPPVPTPTP